MVGWRVNRGESMRGNGALPHATSDSFSTSDSFGEFANFRQLRHLGDLKIGEISRITKKKLQFHEIGRLSLSSQPLTKKHRYGKERKKAINRLTMFDKNPDKSQKKQPNSHCRHGNGCLRT